MLVVEVREIRCGECVGRGGSGRLGGRCVVRGCVCRGGVGCVSVGVVGCLHWGSGGACCNVPRVSPIVSYVVAPRYSSDCVFVVVVSRHLVVDSAVDHLGTGLETVICSAGVRAVRWHPT